ncbi:MAG: hypothetical protein E3J54_01060 [Actinobacteria bacterium]|nr:MAG: hypothetical protein E3J54_01060 [Actinomycetota bacterium]
MLKPPYAEKDISGCAVVGIMNISGNNFGSEKIVNAIKCMRDRSNGLGGGFAAYGIYPEHKDLYAFHMMYLDTNRRYDAEDFLKKKFNIAASERIPTAKVNSISESPVLWRYFLSVENKPPLMSEEDFVVQTVIYINANIDGAFVASSGKNMGVFKGVGYPEDIARFYKLQDYEAYIWLSHGRFPTNTVGWWGGAHPFNILDWSVVHNGELSSYGTNARYLEMYGYKCELMTDTEVVAYTMDLLMRRHKLPLNLVAKVIAAPLWKEIDNLEPKERRILTRLRQTYSSLLLNGPFSFIIANQDQMIGITDRIRLRPLIYASNKDMFYISTEEAAIRTIESDLKNIKIPRGGEPVVAQLLTSDIRHQTSSSREGATN